jgi:kynurenine 3-monooxygenase
VKTQINIVGTGLAGCLLAILLAKRGYKVNVYEKLSQSDCIHDSVKSFSLGFYAYGVKMLKQAGLWDDVKPFAISLKGSITQVSSIKEPIIAGYAMPYYCIARSQLLEVFIEKARQNPLISFHFGVSLIGINRQNKTITIQNARDQKCKTIHSDIIIGADGVNSQVRAFIQSGQQTSHSQQLADWEYKQIHLSKKIGDTLKLHKDVMHAWTRKNAIGVAFPNLDGSYSAMLILPKDHERGFNSLKRKSEIANFIKMQFSDLLPALPVITESLLKNPTGYFSTIITSPWYYKDSIAIIGDAAHGFLPFYGQGMSAAFSDAQKIVELLDKYGMNWRKIFSQYQEERKKNTDVLAYLSKQIFTRYTRQTKADYSSIYEQLEFILHKMFPKIIAPPLFISVALDPGNTAKYLEKQKKQRKIGRLLGVPIIVGLTTILVMLYEKLQSNKF